MCRTDSLERTLMLEKIESRRRRGWQMMKRLDDITDSMDMSLGKLRELVINREAWHVAVHGVTKSGHDWTELIQNYWFLVIFKLQNNFHMNHPKSNTHKVDCIALLSFPGCVNMMVLIPLQLKTYSHTAANHTTFSNNRMSTMKYLTRCISL